MSNIASVIKRTRRIEYLLRSHYHAQGSNLTELIEFCDERLPQNLIEELQHIDQIRDQSIQQDHFRLTNEDEFIAMCKRCEKGLTPRSNRVVWGVALLLVFGFTALAIWFYSLHWHRISLFP
ncbi:DUF4145 domain-containing protein [Photobacterium damselae]|uniref:DUF4145 domain-containing protein n=1 Tax=Photobacterium damselae TaxID=38293 RepID=UPI00165EB462|nr:DUF4145 domain-containing protein [Photobacterium damselae]QOQ68692.1 DUF4145 domain-containing protein [Photobacterium damselae subsp. damselae]